MLVRLILTVLVVVVITLIWRRLRRSRLDGAKVRVIDAKTVRCAHCQVYLPRQDAVEEEGRAYCSVEHAAQARRAPRGR